MMRPASRSPPGVADVNGGYGTAGRAPGRCGAGSDVGVLAFRTFHVIELSHEAWHQILTDLVSRNGAVEVGAVPGDEQDLAPPVYRTRLLSLAEDGSLLIERLRGAGVSRQFSKGAWVNVIAGELSQLWKGRCRVIGLENHRLNASTFVRALRLSPALEICSGQRRQFFRVGTAAGRMQPVMLMPEAACDGPDADGPRYPTDAVAFATQLLNISGGGLGVRLARSDNRSQWLRPGQQFRCLFHLPTVNWRIEVEGRLTRVEEMAHRGTYLALRFEFGDELHQRRVEDRIVRYCTGLQQTQIRRQRRA